MQVGDLIRIRKYGTLGVVVRVHEAAQIDDTRLHVIWVSTGKRGMCWWDEVDVLSKGGKQ